jgi:FtsP/CotA-like multicopper oxidase with cupredoxin domain
MKMHRKITHALSAMTILLAGFIGPAQAEILGITGPTFDLIVAPFHISTPDGARILVWGYGPLGGVPQYPGPTLIVDQGANVEITITNSLTQPTSIVFPGQSNVGASGDTPGLLTVEADIGGGTATYTFNASHAGTYQYHSGTQQALQIEMGLIGAIIVHPSAPNQAYNDADSAYDHEYLFLLTEMDPQVHLLMEFGLINQVDNTTYRPMLWFVNGRPAPDSMAPDNVGWLPNQPYGAMARVHPGETALNRVIGGSRHGHPFHQHGNHIRIIARDGRLLSTNPGSGADLSTEDFTNQVHPGSTFDTLWSWTGEKLGWDIYGGQGDGHNVTGGGPNNCCSNIGYPTDLITGLPLPCGADSDGDGLHDTTSEYCPDHDEPFPVILPELQDLTFGGFYSGSPFLGVSGNLPPGEGGLNLNGGLFFMWHSHNAREQVNFDVPPGGMTTMMIVEPHGVPIP